MMIYSRFGTKLTPVSKQQDDSGRISIQATTEGVTDPRSYTVTELTADDGMPEIDTVIASLPWRTVVVKAQPRHRKIR
jgi:hypothetical protein